MDSQIALASLEVSQKLHFNYAGSSPLTGSDGS